MPGKTAYSYVRFSSEKQKYGASMERQTELARAYCEKHGLYLDDSLTMHDLGVSAFKGANAKIGELARFVQACEDGRVKPGSVLILENLDRMSRDSINPALSLFMKFQSLKIDVVTLSPEKYISYKNPTPWDYMEVIMTFARAHDESKTKSGRIKDSWVRRQNKARTDKSFTSGKVPGWLRKAGEKKAYRFEIIPERAAVIRRIFELCLEGLGVQRITQILNDEGAEGFGRKPGWNSMYVYKILTSGHVVGSYQPTERTETGGRVPVGEPVPGYFPAIVDEETFRAANILLRSKKRQRAGGRSSNDANLFQNLVYDARTKVRMRIRVSHCKRKDAPHVVYRYLVSTASLSRSTPEAPCIPFAVFEDAMLAFLVELRAEDTRPKQERAVGEEERILADLAKLDAKLSRATERAKTEEDTDTYLDLIRDLQRERKGLTGKLVDVQSAVVPVVDHGQTKSLLEQLRTASPADAPALRRRVSRRVYELVKEVWVLIEKVNPDRVAHVQVFLRSGVVRYFAIHHPRPIAAAPQLPPGTDLRDWRP